VDVPDRSANNDWWIHLGLLP